jgi:hypothetical protein
MKMNETTSKQASFLSKEVRRIIFSEITKKDLPELYNTLNQLFINRRHCKLWVCVGGQDCWFNNEAEISQFLHGFVVSMSFHDDNFLDRVVNSHAHRPNV